VTFANRHETIQGYDESRSTTGATIALTSFSKSATSCGRAGTTTPWSWTARLGSLLIPRKSTVSTMWGRSFVRVALCTRPFPAAPSCDYSGWCIGTWTGLRRQACGSHFCHSAVCGRRAAYYADVKERLVQCGRHPDDCKILFGVQPFVAETASAARDKQALHNSLVSLEGAVVHLSGSLGADFSRRLSILLSSPLRRRAPRASSTCIRTLLASG